MHAIKGIFFDLDGTFLDTADDFIVIVNHMLNEHDQPALDEQLIRPYVSAGARALMKLAFKLPPGDELEAKREQFLEHYDCQIRDNNRPTGAHLYPGIMPLIESIEAKHIPWGIVTNKPRPYALSLMQQTGLMDRCRAIVCPEDVKKAKPDPESLLLACDLAGCTPQHSVYIGDHERDIIAGKQAGMLTVAAHYGYILPDDNPHHWQADFDVTNASDVKPWLDRINWAVPT